MAAYRCVQKEPPPLDRHTQQKPPVGPILVRQGEFRWGPGGEVLQAERKAAMRDATVPATIYVEQPHAGLVAATDERASLFARAVDSAACPVIRLQCSDDETSDSERATIARPGATASRGAARRDTRAGHT